jgi:phosphate transport system substrate-binding protein
MVIQGDDMRRSLATVITVAAVATSLLGGAANAAVTKPAFPAIVGNGSSFQANFQAAAIAKFNAKKPALFSTNGNVSYTVSSSGTGMAAFHAGTADFAGTDAPDTTLTSADNGSFVAIPVTAAAVGFIYNVTYQGQQIQGLKFSPALLNSIYKGDVTYWDDAAIQEINGAKWKAATRTTPAGYVGGLSAKLPHTAIHVNVRTDGSGTTKNLNLYMAANTTGQGWNTAGSKNWGSGSSKVITSGSIANYDTRANSSAMISAVSSTDGAFGYADAPDAATAVAAKTLAFGKLKNVAGDYVLPQAAASQKLIDTAKALAGITNNGFLSSAESLGLFSQNVSGAYQLTVITYIQASTANTAKNQAVYSYVNYLLNNSQGAGGFVRLTPALLEIANRQAAKIGSAS